LLLFPLTFAEVKIGDEFQIKVGAGEQALVVVKQIKETSVLLDANHPLAGQDLIFDVEITEQRDATEEELSHGTNCNTSAYPKDTCMALVVTKQALINSFPRRSNGVYY
jgi:FKBP-type peptidyl-prolyl cis-trans isomerase 2